MAFREYTAEERRVIEVRRRNLDFDLNKWAEDHDLELDEVRLENGHIHLTGKIPVEKLLQALAGDIVGRPHVELDGGHFRAQLDEFPAVQRHPDPGVAPPRRRRNGEEVPMVGQPDPYLERDLAPVFENHRTMDGTPYLRPGFNPFVNDDGSTPAMVIEDLAAALGRNFNQNFYQELGQDYPGRSFSEKMPKETQEALGLNYHHARKAYWLQSPDFEINLEQE